MFRFYPTLITCVRFKSSYRNVALVGSGPTSFYLAQYLLKNDKNIKVDMYEKSFAPFGLIRYGVAPDHEDVKNVINVFQSVTKNPNFNYFGNIDIGKDVDVSDLQTAYDATVLAIGASLDRKLNIPGENLSNVISSRDIVGWYNGLPDSSNLITDLNFENVCIVGIGNVALDVARILLSPIERIKKTDIPESVLQVLSQSRVNNVKIISRRGPLQVSFTLKEFRELNNLTFTQSNGTHVKLPVNLYPLGIMEDAISYDETEWKKFVEELPRPKRRIIQFMKGVADEKPPLIDEVGKRCEILFLKSPKEILASDQDPNRCGAIDLSQNYLKGLPGLSQEIRNDAESSLKIDCGMVVKCLGYKVMEIPNVPYNHKKDVIETMDDLGRISNWSQVLDEYKCAFYASGWSRKGAKGVIVDSGIDGRTTGEAIMRDFQEISQLNNSEKKGFSLIESILTSRNVKFTTFQDWEKVDTEETRMGSKLGKPREKITSNEKLFKIILSNTLKERDNALS